MIIGHVFRNRGILATPAVKSTMGSDSVMIEKNFNSCVCHPHIDLIFDILMRHGVVHTVYCDVIVELDGGSFPLGRFEGCGRQRCQ